VSSALREIAGDGDEIRLQRVHGAQQRLDQGRIDAAEMQVGEMDERPYSSPTSRRYFMSVTS
jgi:hypothetical protein